MLWDQILNRIFQLEQIKNNIAQLDLSITPGALIKSHVRMSIIADSVCIIADIYIIATLWTWNNYSTYLSNIVLWL